jgi:GNAT superfamily N-acetyltransferase
VLPHRIGSLDRDAARCQSRSRARFILRYCLVQRGFRLHLQPAGIGVSAAASALEAPDVDANTRDVYDGQNAMPFCDLALSRRLERAEGHACVQFAEARRRLFPESGSEWMECSGAYVVFDGIGSPLTQTFGLGIFEELNGDSLDAIERFFLDRGAQVDHEVSPLVGVAALSLLCSRRYRPIEISNVMYRPIEKRVAEDYDNIRVRVTGPEEAELWTGTSAKAWTHDHPELLDFFSGITAISAAREGSLSFLAELQGQPGASASLCLHNGVALFAGAATIPEMRRRGLQAALLQERLRYAFDCGCDLAMMVAEAGSDSQRNAERKGFQIAYTRLKWRLGA